MGDRPPGVRTAGASSGGRWSRYWPVVLAALLALAVLGPALLPGYVLSYDMVWVPNLSLRPDALGLGTQLPRAVPSDAVVAVLDQVVPGALLQKMVLLGGLVAGGTGAAALVCGLSWAGRAAALTFYEWSPFVAERLVLGHWPLLLTWAVLPWLVVTARSEDGRARTPRAWWLLVPLASLSAAGGVLTAVVVLALRARGIAASAAVAGTVLVTNAPWLVAGLAHAGSAYSDPRAASVFGLHGEGLLPAPLAALVQAGVWNSDVVPGSQLGLLAVVQLVVILVLAGIGGAAWWRATSVRESSALLTCWVVGLVVALLTWASPQVVGAMAAHLPGGGLLRDGSRALVLCGPLLVSVLGTAVDRLYRSAVGAGARAVIGGGLVVLPLVLLPDLALGADGRLDAVSYPASYAAVRGVVGDNGRVLLLPFTSYRAPAWNGGRPVLDPLERYLRPTTIASDDLLVGGTTIRGEDPLAARVRRALEARDLARLERVLRLAGVRTVVLDRTAGPAPDVPGPHLTRGSLVVIRLPDRPAGHDVADAVDGRRGAIVRTAWMVWLLGLGAGVAAGAVRLAGRARGTGVDATKDTSGP